MRGIVGWDRGIVSWDRGIVGRDRRVLRRNVVVGHRGLVRVLGKMLARGRARGRRVMIDDRRCLVTNRRGWLLVPSVHGGTQV